MSCSFDIKPGDRHCEFCTVIGCGERDGAQYDTAATTSALPHGHYENVCQSRGSSRAEQAAVERFPHGKYDAEQGDALRYACIAGYHKAEKDTREELLAWAEEQIAHHEKMLKNYPNEREYMAFVGAYQNMIDKLKKI